MEKSVRERERGNDFAIHCIMILRLIRWPVWPAQQWPQLTPTPPVHTPYCPAAFFFFHICALPGQLALRQSSCLLSPDILHVTTSKGMQINQRQVSKWLIWMRDDVGIMRTISGLWLTSVSDVQNSVTWRLMASAWRLEVSKLRSFHLNTIVIFESWTQ